MRRAITRRRHRWVAVLIAALLGLLAGAPQAASEPPVAPQNPAPLEPLILVMDVSGSMSGERLANAKEAATAFIDNAAIHEKVGLFTYPGGKQKDGCYPGVFRVAPDGAYSAEDVRVAVGGLTAGGNTPTGPALEAILDYLAANNFGRGRVVLISDGEANCGETDVCAYAGVMASYGIDLEISTVSFDNTETGSAALKCLAESTGGTYTDAQNWEEAIEALRANQSFRAELEVTTPAVLIGARADIGSYFQELTVEVTPTGRQAIPNATLVMTIVGVDDSATDPQRRVWVQRPVRHLGNLPAPPASGPQVAATQRYPVRPTITANGEVQWTVTLLSNNVPIARHTGTIPAVSDAEAGPVFAEAKHVVILGDSYSSGEGAGDYTDLDHRDAQRQYCHRSPHAYGTVLFPGATMIACSGAISEHLRQPQIAKHSAGMVEAQLVQLMKDMDENGPPDLVLMTLGGNDVGFGPQVTACVLPKCTTLAEVDWSVLTTNLTNRYRDVNALVNSPNAVQLRGGRAAQIVVLPYANPVPPAVDKRSWCLGFVDVEELRLLKPFMTNTNASVEQAVSRAQDEGIPIHFAAPVQDVMSTQHHMCSEEPWVVVDRLLDRAAVGDHAKNELVHPNKAGHAAIADVLTEWSRGIEPLPLTATTSTADVRIVQVTAVRGASIAATVHGVDDTGWPTSLLWTHLEPGRPLDLNATCEKAWGKTTCFWTDRYPVWVQLKSLPQPLGAYWPDEYGMLPVVPIPLDTPPGKHTLVVRAFDDDGNPRVTEIPVRVWPEGTGRALDLAVLAGGLGLIGGALLLIGTIRSALHRKRTAVGEVS